MPGSANHVSLEGAQHNYAEFGAAERRHRGTGRAPLNIESREAGWRLLDPARDNVEEPQHRIDYGDTYPLADTTVLLLAHDLLAAAGELIPTRFPHRLLLPGAPNLINAVVPCFPAWVWRRSLVLKHLMIDLYQSRICRPTPHSQSSACRSGYP